MLSGIAQSAVRSPTFTPLKHDRVSLATPGTEACGAGGGALRPKWREGQREVLGGYYPSGWPLPCCWLRSLRYARVARHLAEMVIDRVQCEDACAAVDFFSFSSCIFRRSRQRLTWS